MTSLPSGTVTFLFTDIEGSTKLWEQHPEPMRLAVARHDVILRQAVKKNLGYLFKTTGDGIAAAFATAAQGVHAVLDAQLALSAEAWPEPILLRSRMGLHTGAAELRDNDYFGPSLNRCARLMAAGNGGQALLSDPTRELCRDSLPSGVILLPLGEHRLKDLTRPETVYQLAHPALQETFPPLRTLDNPTLPNNLPQQLTSFVGREAEIDTVKDLLSKTLLLTLTGAGGSGKTRLSLQVAADVLEEYPDGVWQAELAPVSDPALVPQAVAAVLGLREETGRTLLQVLTDHLKDRRLLLILDNCEHVLPACAHLVAALLRGCPGIKVIATSRELLGIAGEQTYRVPSLSTPDRSQTQSATSISLSQFESVRLFIDRARSVAVDFTVTNANAPALAQVCFRLDGIPLAIELAAARVRAMTIEQINDRLDNRFRLLTGGDRSALPRQQTLRALIDWSYDLLTGQEKALLGRLSVFTGGWSLGAAEQVGSGVAPSGRAGEEIEDSDIVDLLTSLADKSLVLAQTRFEETRYGLLETVRQYAADRLRESGAADAVHARHRGYFLALAEEADSHMQGPEQVRWLNTLEREHDNLREALASCREYSDSGPIELRLSAALGWFWMVRGYHSEGCVHLQRTLARPENAVPTIARVAGLHIVGMLLFTQGNSESAAPWYEQSLALNRQAIHDARYECWSLHDLGLVAFERGELASGRAALEEALLLAANETWRGLILGNLANLTMAQGDLTRARSLLDQGLLDADVQGDQRSRGALTKQLAWLDLREGDELAAKRGFEQSLALFREIGGKTESVDGLAGLTVVAYRRGELAKAQGLSLERLALGRDLASMFVIVGALNDLGLVAHTLGNDVAAKAYLAESVTLCAESGDQPECHGEFAQALETIGMLISERNEDNTISPVEVSRIATRLLGKADALGTETRSSLSSNQPARDQCLSCLRDTLGDVFAAEWVAGRALTWEQAAALAQLSV